MESESSVDVKPIVCSNCYEIFDSVEMLSAHTCIEKKPVVCDLCYLVFEDENGLSEHRSSHHNGGGNEDMITDPDADILSRMDCDNDDDVKPLVCNLCGDVFCTVEAFNEHTLTHVEVKPMVCGVCNMIFGELDTYSEHMKLHEQENPQEETEAHQELPQEQPFVQGDNHLHSATKEHCAHCNKTFATKYNLDRHMRAHKTNEQYHTCTVCQKTFNQKSSLKNHMDNHTVYTCGACKRTFLEKAELNVHMLVHSEHGSFLCGKCNTAFSEKSKLESHLLINHGIVVKSIVLQKRSIEPEKHSSASGSSVVEKVWNQTTDTKFGEENMRIDPEMPPKTYQCLDCPKKFPDAVSLAAHKRAHRPGKLYKCAICSLRFLDQETIKMHLVKDHKAKVNFPQPEGPLRGQDHVCKQCRRIFKDQSSLLAHMKEHSSKRFQCELCNEVFPGHYELYFHTLTHSKKCEKCDHTFRRESELRNHMLTVHNSIKPTVQTLPECVQCRKIFSTKFKYEEHMTTVHKNDTAHKYECAICMKMFNDKASLDEHAPECSKDQSEDKSALQSVVMANLRYHTCTACKMAFHTKAEFDKHNLMHNIDKVYQGSNSRKDNLNPSQDQIVGRKTPNRKHSFSTQKTNIYQCKQCKQCFQSPMELNEHIKGHKAAGAFNCELCERACHSKTSLKLHMRKVHLNSVPFELKVGTVKTEPITQIGDLHKCEMCNANFTQVKFLKKHIGAMHTTSGTRATKPASNRNSARPFKCEYCDLTFVRKSSLDLHLPIHNLKRPHQCAKCSQSFISKEELDEHSEVHVPTKEFVCEVCSSPFATKHSLTNHMRMHTGKNLVHCPDCGKIFTRNSELTKHAVVHKKQ